MSAPWEGAADVVIVGSGVAGLSAALEATRFGLRTVVIANLKRAVRDCDVLREWQRAPHLYTDVATRAIFPLLSRDFAPLEHRLGNARSRLDAIPDLLETARHNLTPDASPISCEIASRAARGGATFFRSAVPAAAARANNNDAIRDDVVNAAGRAAASLQDFAEYVDRLKTSATGDFAAA